MADSADALRLAETLAARLCHDLSGLIGSLNQALEMAAPEVPTDNEAFALARQAAGSLARRLRWRRAAWAENGPALDIAALRNLTSELEIDLAGLAPDSLFAPPMARVLLNILLLARESLPRGGRIALSGTAADVFIAIDGPTASWPAGTALCLVDEGAAMAAVSDPTTLQMPLTALLARRFGLRLSMLLGVNAGDPPPLRLSEL